MPLLNEKLGIDFSDYIADRTENFTGRNWVFESIQNWLAETKGERFFLLTGEPGSGKTAIAARLTQCAQADQVTLGFAPGFLQAVHFCSARDSLWLDPKEFSRSIALQLAQAVPEFALALKDVGEKTTNINVDMKLGTAQNSTVQGVMIQNLTVSGLSGQEAFNQLVVNPLRQIREEGFNQPVTLLVDSLDEALTHDGETTIVGLLSKLSSSAKVRLILTSRNEARVKEKLTAYEELFLSATEHLQRNRHDVQGYISQRFSQDETLQEKLASASLEPEKLTTALTDQSEGNFLYVRFFLEAVALGQQSLANLEGLPQGLDELYYESLRRVVELGKKDWVEAYAPVMGVLLAAQESLTTGQIQAFTMLKESMVLHCLNDLQQFLDEIELEDEESRYKLYHQSVTDFLGERQLLIRKKKQPNRYYLPTQEQHQQIVKHYRPAAQPWAEVQLDKLDAYGRRYLAQHLVKADRVEELHTLLSLEKNGKNAWFKVKDDEGDTAGFLSDVELAWAQVDGAYDDLEPGKSIGLQCRYALIKTSINSLAEIPMTLMIALVEHKHWKPAKALAYACQIPDPQHRVGSLTALATKLPNTEPLKQQILQIALQEIQSIQEPSARAHALTALANDLPVVLSQALETIQAIKIQDRSARAQSVPAYALLGIVDKLTPALLPKALEVVQEIQDEYWRAYALAGLAGKLTQELLPKALEIVQEIQRDDARAEALTSLIKLQPELLPKVLEATQSIQDDMSRANILIDLVDKLPSDLLPKVLEVVQLIRDDYQRVRTLVAFANELPRVIPNTLEAIQSIQDASLQAMAVASLVNKLSSELPPQILDIAQSIQDDRSRADALAALAHKLPEAIPPALKAIQLVQSDYYRVENIIALVNKLAPELLSQVLEAARSVQDSYERARVLIALAGKLPDVLPKTIEAVQAIQDDYHRSEALVALINKVPLKWLPEFLEMVQSIQGNYERARALTALADKLPEVLPQALEAAQSIERDDFRARALTALADKFPELLPQAVEGIKAIQLTYSRNEALTALSNRVPPELLPKALEAVQLIQDDYPRACVLTALVDELPGVLPQALEAVQAIRDDEFRALALTVLSGKLTKELLPKALEIAQSIQNDRSYTDVLIVLVERLTPELLSKVLETAQSIGDDYNRARVLTALTNKLPDLLPRALKAARSIQSEYNRVEVLTALLDSLTPDLLPIALEAVQSIRDDYNRAQMLIALADKLPDVLHQALESAQLIQHDESRAQVLTSLVDKLPDLFPQALEAVQSIQADYNRAQALSALAAKVPKLLPQALEAAQLIQNANLRVSVLAALVDELPEVLPQALEAAQSIQDANLRASALTTLVEKLPELFPQALDAAQSIQYDSRDEGRGDYDRAQILTALANKLPPDLLPQTLEAAQSTQGAHDRTQILSVLVKHLVNAPNRSDLWKNSLHFLSSRTRNDLLSDFTALSPLMIALGDKSSTLEIARAIQDICKWWA